MNDRKNLSSMLAEFERPLGAAGGREYWQCLDELAGTESFQELMRQEFPALADVWHSALSRRKFLSLMGASLALAGIGGCSVRPAPEGTIVPYVKRPELVVPGTPLFYATTLVHAGDAMGVLVESHEGRPTKIEGNPDHPASLGATDAFSQASILGLYDPLRSQTVVQGDRILGWDDAESAIRSAMLGPSAKRGAGLRILTEGVVSPTLESQLERLLTAYPDSKWHQYEPIHTANAYRASQIAFGQPVDMVFDFRAANVVLSLDADFLFRDAGHVRYANDFMSRRRVRTTAEAAPKAEMNRLYVVETEVTSTGAKADHRLAVRMREIQDIAAAVAAELGVEGVAAASDQHAKWAAAVARDLVANRGSSLVVCGHRQPPGVHLLAHAMNERLGNVGHTVRYIKPITGHPADQLESLRELVTEMERGAVEVLVVLGGNPAYTAPVDYQFAAALGKVKHSFHLGLYENETSRLCKWHLPEAHYLEAWSDARAFDGTVSLAQPLIAPLYQGRSEHEVLAAFAGERERDGLRIVQSYWRDHSGQHQGQPDFEVFWQTALHDGVIKNSSSPALSAQLRDGWQSALKNSAAQPAPQEPQQLEIAFQSDPTIYDGRYATNGWLQELPKPFTKLTWDNAAIVSPRTAKEFGLEYGAFDHGGEHGGYDVPMVALRVGEREVQAPIWIMPGHADGAVTVNLGYGQTHAARANGAWQQTLGFNAYELRTSDHPWFSAGLVLTKLDSTYPIACTQGHNAMNGEIIRAGTLGEFRRQPHKIASQEEGPRGANKIEGTPPRGTLYESFDYGPSTHKWGMSIDMTACIGCNACVVACQAENNIPVVGKEQVRFGREMHWLRIDRYVHGSAEAPDEFYFQPVLCMHCEHAPCEYVCPVAATVHSPDGLNEMVYNRCVGTRFCSNNCPYKVRRFNFLEFADFKTVPLRMQYNPDVTVRSRGVMEKCSYCIQRIRQAEIKSDAAERPIRDGEVLTACQAACPAQAIVFGDMNDKSSAVAATKASPLDYSLLEELNTYPRTTYLAALRNPNPELEGV
jgi:molybdopterin-containing oxidoreductase family iron-sulfur binding subunit